MTIDEGGSDIYTVGLASQPTDNVTVTIGGAGGDVTASPTPLTFTTSNWSTAQTVTVNVGEDDDAVADRLVTLTHTVAGGDYTGTSADSVTVTVTEKDTPTLAVANAQASEGDVAVVFTITLSTASSNEVTVDYATSDGTAAAGSDYTTTSGTLTFTAGSTDSQTVSVPVTDDSVDEDEQETFMLTLSGATNATLAGGNATLEATGTIRDNDVPQVTISFGATSYDGTEGTRVSVPITMSADPEHRVVIIVEHIPQDGATSDDYTMWQTSKAFTKGGGLTKTFGFNVSPDDVESVLLSFINLPDGVTEGSVPTTTINIVDDDARGVTVSEDTLTVPEGGSSTYTVKLDSQPTANVTVDIGGAAGDVSIEPSLLTFTTSNWDQETTVTVSAAEDDDGVAEAALTVTHTVRGGDYEDLTA